MGVATASLVHVPGYRMGRQPLEGEWLPAASPRPDTRRARDFDEGRELPVVYVTDRAPRSMSPALSSSRSLSSIAAYQQVLNLSEEQGPIFSVRA